jgi:mgtE-like transporter
MSVLAVARDAYRAALPALAASLAGGLVAGATLGGMRADLAALPGLLVLVPALLAVRGTVYGALGARIATALHQGVLAPRLVADDRLLRAGAAALANGLLASTVAACVVFGLLSAVGRSVAPLPALVAIALLAGVCSGLVLVVVVVVAAVVGYRRGADPDALVGPVVTTTGDVFGLLFLLLAARLVRRGGLADPGLLAALRATAGVGG